MLTATEKHICSFALPHLAICSLQLRVTIYRNLFVAASHYHILKVVCCSFALAQLEVCLLQLRTCGLSNVLCQASCCDLLRAVIGDMPQIVYCAGAVASPTDVC